MATQESSNTANLAGEAPDDNLVDTESVDNNKTVTEKAYNELGNTIKGFVILCRGLKKDNGDLLIDIDSEEPWKGVGRTQIKPSNPDLKREIDRRYALNPVGIKPRCSAWNNAERLKWLDQHPIAGEQDVSFLNEKYKEYKKILQDAMTAAAREEDALQKGWTGSLPYLRLIHCIIDDRIKPAYLKRNDLSANRLAVENRNSVLAQSSVYSLIADLWNDNDFEPETESIADLHDDFILPQTITFEKVASYAAANSVGALDGAESVPMSSVTTVGENSAFTTRGTKKTSNGDEALNRLSQSIDNLTRESTLSDLKRRLDDAQERTRAAKMKKFEAENGPEERRFMAQFYSQQVLELEATE